MNGDRRRRHAATLLLITSAVWLHQWLPALLVAAWVSWLLLHKRLEGGFGDALLRLWRRAWPPGALVLIPLLAVNALAYWAYAPMPGNVMPIALNLLGLAIVLLGGWWSTARSLGARLRRAPVAQPRLGPGPAKA